MISSLRADTSKAVPHHATQRAICPGEIIGSIHQNGCHVWLGIPYAEPPVGPLRWRAPRPAASWTNIREAVMPGHCCCQPPAFGALVSTPQGSEDCLYLNIWAPPDADYAQLPVMLWIHGGSNSKGQGAAFDGSVLSMTQGVIVVTVNYRLGVFGWFFHPALHSGDTSLDDRSGNYALLDLVAALQWLRDNIAAFGGDPNRITLFGESSGGLNIFGLLVSPRARGLFHRAIIQSGVTVSVSPGTALHYVDSDDPGSPKSAGELLLQLLIDDENASDRASAKRIVEAMTDTEIAAYLRGKDFCDFESAYAAISTRTAMPAVLPMLIRDGYVLPSDGITAALGRRDGCQHVPILLGCTRDEFTILAPLIGASPRLIRPKANQFGFSIIDREGYALFCEYLSRFQKIDCVDMPATLLAQHGHDLYLYRFDWDRLQPAPWLDDFQLGAAHGLDVPFVFGHLQLGREFIQIPLIAADALPSFHHLSAAMMAYWAEFANSGHPGRGRNGTLPYWQAFTAQRTIMLLDADKRGVNLSQQEVVSEDLYQALIEDPRPRDARTRCQLIYEVMRLRQFAQGETN